MPRSVRRAAALAVLGAALILAGCGRDADSVLPASVVQLDLGVEPRGLSLGFAPQTLWVSGFDADRVFEIDPTTHKVQTYLPVLAGPGDLVPDPAHHCLYCLHLKTNAITILGGEPLRVMRRLGTGNISLASGVLRPGGNELWISDGLEKLQVLVTPSLALKGEWQVGRYPQRIAFSPDGRIAWVTLKGENAVVALDVARHREVARVPVGIYPRDLVLVGTTACVSNFGSNDVSLVDLPSRKERARLPVRSEPNSLAVHDGVVWVACEDSYRVIAIDVARARTLGSLKTGFYPGALLARADGSLVVADPRHKRLYFFTPTSPH